MTGYLRRTLLRCFRRRRHGSAAVTLILLSACVAEPTPSPTDFSSQLDQAKCNAVKAFDADCDGVLNASDRVAGRHDYGDDDGDFVFNALDLHAGIDDTTVDGDADTIPDYLDDYAGNNYADDDLDGIPNGVDLEPQTTLPAGQAPSTQDNRTLAENIVLNSMRTDLWKDLIDRGPDSDLDGIPDRVDSTPTDYTNDRDNDGSPDFYDPDAGNPWVSEEYDPYDPSSDAYYEDPYDPSSDAYFDDDNNGWGD